MCVLMCVNTYGVIQEYSLAASALQLLMKLKRHLKVVFSLDDARCQVVLLFSFWIFYYQFVRIVWRIINNV